MTSPSPAPPARNTSSTSRRSASLGFLRRSKSSDLIGERKVSGNRLSRRKQKEMNEEEARRQKGLTATPPTLPGFTPHPQMQPFGNESSNMASRETYYSTNGSSGVPPVPPLPGSMEKEVIDPYARTESMTHRGRYSYANSTVSTLNSPRRVRRRKDPTPYNVLIIGAKNSGKTSFLNFLKKSLALPPKKQPHRDAGADTPPPSARSNRNYVHHYQEIEVENERIGLTLWDSQGLEKNVVDLQLREMSNFVENKFEDTFIEEMKVVRAPGVRDTHIHCVFFILDPVRLDSNIQASQQSNSNGSSGNKFGKTSRIIGGLDDDFDLQVLRTLQGKTTVVPIISKADTITAAHMAFLKKTVWESLRKAGLDPLEALNFEVEEESEDEMNKLDERDEDEDARKNGMNGDGDSSSTASPKSDDSETLPEEERTPNVKRQLSHKRQSSQILPTTSTLDKGYVPMSILSPDSYSLASGGPLGRQFPWGFADPHNAEHCDFVKLKEACFGDWRAELREASREVFYERWRTSRLNRQGGSTNGARNTPEPRKVSAGGIPPGILRTKGR